VALSAMMLFGCSSKTTTTTTAPITLYWWRSQADVKQETLDTMIASFEGNNPGIKIEVVLKDPRVYEQEAVDAMASHASTEQSPDILSVKSEEMPSFVPKLTAAPTTLFDAVLTAKKKTGKTAVETTEETYETAAAKSVILNDASGSPALYGLPMAMDSLALYRNTAVLQSASDSLATTSKNDMTDESLKSLKSKITTAPKTWQDIVDIVPYITVKDGDNITRSAIAMGSSKNVERSYDILQTIMMQNGTKLTSNDLNSATFNLSQTGAVSTVNPGEQALKFYLRFATPTDSIYTWNDSIATSSVDAFATGQTAMMIQYASAYSAIIAKAPNLKSSIDVSPMPQIADPTTADSSALKTMSRMWVETVPSAKGDATRQKAAWKFVQYITSKEGSSEYLSAMKLPSALKGVTGKSKLDAFTTQKTYADTWYKGNSPDKIDEMFIDMISSALGGTSTKDALDKTNTNTSTILQGSTSKWSTAVGVTTSKEADEAASN